MSVAAVARRYARAALEIGKEDGTVETLAHELRDFAASYQQSPELRAIEMSPDVGDPERQQIVAEIGQRLGVSQTTISTVSILALRQRLAILPELAQQMSELADEHLGLVRVSVRAARPLSQDYLHKLESTIAEATGKKVLLDVTDDPSLIAGVVTQIGDRIVDGSVRAKLDQLAASLRQG